MKNMTIEELIDYESKTSFEFFWNEANSDPKSLGYGLIKDNTAPGFERMSSIASVGFGLSAIIIGIERSWITKDQGKERTLGTLKTFLNNAEHLDGFFYHFLDMKTAKRYEASYDCASIIDTAIFLNGAITSAEYFDGEIKELFEAIYARVEWTQYYDEERNVFYMGYVEKTGGFGQWDMYAEQLMQYILGVGSPTYPVPAKIYDGFSRNIFNYGDYEFLTAPGNALFMHQFSHAWYDFRNTEDKDGIDWFENSVLASQAQHQYAIDNSKKYTTYHKDSWGITASMSPNGYTPMGSPAYLNGVNDAHDDGTVAPTAATASINFTPEASKSALLHYYKHDNLHGKYGLKDSYNTEVNPHYYADRYIGIDKGITLLMFENYRSSLIWDLYMQNYYVQQATKTLKWNKR